MRCGAIGSAPIARRRAIADGWACADCGEPVAAELMARGERLHERCPGAPLRRLILRQQVLRGLVGGARLALLLPRVEERHHEDDDDEAEREPLRNFERRVPSRME